MNFTGILMIAIGLFSCSAHLDNGDKVFSTDSLKTLSCRLESALEE